MRRYIISIICAIIAFASNSIAQVHVWDDALGNPTSGSYQVNAAAGELRVPHEIPYSPDTDWSVVADNLDMGFRGSGQTWIRVLDIEVVSERKVNIVISYSENTSERYSRNAYLGNETTFIEIIQKPRDADPVTPPDPDPDPDPGDEDEDDDYPVPGPNPPSPDVPDMDAPDAGLSVDSCRNWIITEIPSLGGNAKEVMYYDGLGYLAQRINVGGGASPFDIVSIFSHDIFGNETIRYLPYAGGEADGAYKMDGLSEQRSYYASVFGTSDGAKAYDKTEYEACPGGRPLRSSLSGVTLSSHPSNTEHITNKTGEIEILDVDAATGDAVVAGYYPAGSLYGERVTDGDGRIATRWKDFDGRTIRIDTGTGDSEARTLFGYDFRGNLCWAVSPEGYVRLPASGVDIPIDGDLARRYCWRYRYDSRGNLTATYRPGAGLQLTLHDAAGHLIMSQDQNMRDKGIWIGYTYDEVGRVLTESIIRDTTTTDWTAMLPELDREGLATLSETLDRDTLRAYSYDRIPSNLGGDMAFEEITGLVTSDMVNLDWRGRLAYEKVSTTNGEPYSERVYYYDSRGNVIQFVERRSSGTLRSSFRYDTQRRLLTSQSEYSEPGNDINDVYVRAFTYDKDGRILTESADLNGHTANVEYRYDNLGRLVTKVHSDGTTAGSRLCERFTYNLQGWENERSVSVGEDEIYSSRLGYYDASPDVEPSFTGDISSWKWSRGGSTEREYRFSYDELNRLTDAMEYVGDILKNTHTERGIRYDRNGNILSMTRTNGADTKNISFTYDGNRRTNGRFSYDSNGNIISDSFSGVSASYDILNMPCSLYGDGDYSAEYTYLADGTKISSKMEELYHGYYYVGPFVYLLVSDNYAPDGVSVSYGGNGRLIRDDVGLYSNVVYIQDHLGSTRTKVKDRKNIIGEYDYLPYGELTSYSTVGYANDFLYGGKELEAGHNVLWYDSGARYQTTHGIFTSQDPLSEQYYSISPYAYCVGNPVNLTDPYGLTSYNVNGRIQEIEDGYYETISVSNREFRALERDWNRGYGESYDNRRQGLMDKYGYVDGSGNPVLAAGIVYSDGSDYLSFVLGLIAADIAIVEPSDAVPHKWAGYAVGAATAFGVDYYINKMNTEIARINTRPDGPMGVQYALRATVSKEYPNVRGGTTYLKAGDVWKYGETTQYPPENRYGGELNLKNRNLKFVIESSGTQKQMKKEEKYKIYSYFITHGHLPPGNSIFR